LPDTIQDIYTQIFHGMTASKETLMHLKCELMHAIWELLLDPEFMHAYEHGIVVKCADGILWHLFPPFFTYSADYPEKVLLATIQYPAISPCPHCLVKKNDIGALGMTVDMQR
ncbi:hypothetical protein L208DRAFT_1341622, partial [Tricholoma matsutake]